MAVPAQPGSAAFCGRCAVCADQNEPGRRGSALEAPAEGNVSSVPSPLHTLCARSSAIRLPHGSRCSRWDPTCHLVPLLSSVSPKISFLQPFPVPSQNPSCPELPPVLHSPSTSGTLQQPLQRPAPRLPRPKRLSGHSRTRGRLQLGVDHWRVLRVLTLKRDLGWALQSCTQSSLKNVKGAIQSFRAEKSRMT